MPIQPSGPGSHISKYYFTKHNVSSFSGQTHRGIADEVVIRLKPLSERLSFILFNHIQ